MDSNDWLAVKRFVWVWCGTTRTRTPKPCHLICLLAPCLRRSPEQVPFRHPCVQQWTFQLPETTEAMISSSERESVECLSKSRVKKRSSSWSGHPLASTWGHGPLRWMASQDTVDMREVFQRRAVVMRTVPVFSKVHSRQHSGLLWKKDCWEKQPGFSSRSSGMEVVHVSAQNDLVSTTSRRQSPPGSSWKNGAKHSPVEIGYRACRPLSKVQ